MPHRLPSANPLFAMNQEMFLLYSDTLLVLGQLKEVGLRLIIPERFAVYGFLAVDGTVKRKKLYRFARYLNILEN